MNDNRAAHVILSFHHTHFHTRDETLQSFEKEGALGCVNWPPTVGGGQDAVSCNLGHVDSRNSVGATNMNKRRKPVNLGLVLIRNKYEYYRRNVVGLLSRVLHESY